MSFFDNSSPLKRRKNKHHELLLENKEIGVVIFASIAWSFMPQDLQIESTHSKIIQLAKRINVFEKSLDINKEKYLQSAMKLKVLT